MSRQPGHHLLLQPQRLGRIAFGGSGLGAVKPALHFCRNVWLRLCQQRLT